MNKKNLFLTIALIIIPVLAYVWIQKNGKREPITNDRREPITIVYHASYERLLLDDLIIRSDLIVIGNLKTIHASRWNTPDGNRPEGDPAQGIKPGNLIFTDMDFNATQLIKGDTQQKKARIRSLGGIVDGDLMVADKIIPEMGKTYLLFLNLNKRGSTANIIPGHYWITGGGWQGLYEIIDGRAISKVDEWNLDELIVYIQNKLSEPPTPTSIPAEATSTETSLSVSTSSTDVAVTETPLPTDLPTETPLPVLAP